MSGSVTADAGYTGSDHLFRETDPYARAKYDLALRWLDRALLPGRLVYNVGCGGGYFSALAAARGCTVVACEPDPQAYALAAKSAPAGVTVLACGLDAFAANRPPADVVVMHDVLEHIEDDGAAVEQLARLVRPGGALAISVPSMPALFGLHDELLGHYRRYRQAELRRLIGRRFR
ncbi:MAG TPA: class I SAM-dependent methyltransferase, partial [Verrucomicrobiae bacterium]|nr:class I SAM-dependent methyltransferase [Verrucomicrobiae bacterium]